MSKEMYKRLDSIKDFSFVNHKDYPLSNIFKQAVNGTRSLTLAQRAQADLNYDYKINQKDIDILSKYLLGEIKEF